MFEFWKDDYMISDINSPKDLESHLVKNANDVLVYMITPPKIVGLLFIHDYKEELNVYMPNTFWYTVYVLPHYRGVGICNRLMKSAYETLLDRNINIVYISCKKSLMKFYDKYGYIKFSNKSNDEVVMYKYLEKNR